MKKLFTLHLAALLALAPLVPAQATQQTLSIGPFFGGDAPYRIDQQLQKGDQNFNDLYTRAGDVPLSYGGWFPGEGLNSQASGAAQQGAQRHLMYLPHGASSLRLVFSNTGASQTSGEADAASGMPVNIGIETNVPAPWNSLTTYAAGASVTFLSSQYTASVANTGVQPGAFNTATWTSVPLTTPKPVTCGGIRACGTVLQATASGTSVPNGFFTTDYFPANVPATGGWIAVDMFPNQPAAAGTVNTVYTGATTNALSGEYSNFSTSISDLSATGSFPAQNFISSVMSPIAIGRPAVTGPTACLVGDSIAAGNMGGQGLVYISSFTPNGTGFVASDVGRIGQVTSTNNAAGVVNTNATVMIAPNGVSGGQVTSLIMIDPGNYTSAVSSGPYTVTFPGSAGSSVTITSIAASVAHDIKGPYGTQGSLQRALADNGIPVVNFTKSSDLLSAYQIRDYTRLSVIRAVGCSTAIIELSVNDQAAGASAATILSRAQALALQLKGLGTVKKVILTTMTPNGLSSSDTYVNPNNESANPGSAAIHAAFNQSVRAVPAWADGVIDSSGCVEALPQDSDLWKTDGQTVGLWTVDGIHKSETGIPLTEPCEAAFIKALVASGAIM